ncbi:MAG: glycosyltransferase, partial [Planctomycetota bacterium]|nr:glycosyltransferase [Planctomycetota bacterium]
MRLWTDEGISPINLGRQGAMNIVHYFRRMRFEDGGPVRAVIDLTDRLAGAGNAVRLVTTDDADVPPDRPRTHGAEPFGSPGRPVRVFPIDGATSVAGFLKTPALQTAGRILEGADILHLHGAWDTSNLQFAKMARRMGIPYIVSPRGMLDDWCMAQRPLKKRVYHALVGKRFFEGAAGVHCTAEAELAQSKKWFPRGRGFVVPNLLDLTPYHDLPDVQVARDAFPDLKTEDAVLLFLSRIHEKKGIELLIRATRVLKDRGMRVRTLIAGTGDKAYTESLQRLASTEGVSDRVKFLGMVGGEAKLALYRDADLFVLPTSQENFGFVLPE